MPRMRGSQALAFFDPRSFLCKFVVKCQPRSALSMWSRPNVDPPFINVSFEKTITMGDEDDCSWPDVSITTYDACARDQSSIFQSFHLGVSIKHFNFHCLYGNRFQRGLFFIFYFFPSVWWKTPSKVRIPIVCSCFVQFTFINYVYFSFLDSFFKKKKEQVRG